MGTVYLVTSGEYSDYKVEAIFSTKEAADAYAVAAQTSHKFYDVMDMPIDSATPPVIVTAYYARIALGNGDVTGTWDCREEADNLRETDIFFQNYGEPAFEIRSVVSRDHAVKVAVECRQKYLREAADQQASDAESVRKFRESFLQYVETGGH